MTNVIIWPVFLKQFYNKKNMYMRELPKSNILNCIRGDLFAWLMPLLFIIFSCREGMASDNAAHYGIMNAKDTSVSFFVNSYLENKDNVLRLYYPNTVKRFYGLNNQEAAWVKEKADPKQTWQAMLLLDCVLQYGLFHEDYHPKELLYDPLHDMLEVPGKIRNSQKARFDILLTDALITLMNNLHYGKLNPAYNSNKIDSGMMVPFHAENALLAARQQKDFMSAVTSVQPRSKLYAAMQDRMRQLKGVYQEDCYEVPESEVRKIAINMERLRWAEIDETTYIEVNIPSFTLKFYRPDTFYKFKVIVGAPAAPTPTFNSQIIWVTTFPKWKITDRSFSPIPHPGKLVFRFADPGHVLMYESADKRLFGHSERAAGNGNIRMENSDALVRLLLAYPGMGDKLRLFNKAMKGRLTRNISLAKPVPIKVTYITCEVHKGIVVSYKDIYNLDKGLESALYNTTETLTLK